MHLRELSNAIRVLSLDSVEAARSGHPGAPLGLADVASVLFLKFFKNCTRYPDWPDRDRFILSAGHASAMLYSVLYLLGYDDVELGDLKSFRKIGSKTAGHPERGFLKGVEVTTGPLGQGVANAVGYALAEKRLKSEFGRDLVDHKVFVIAGDGCLMEGVSSEALSLAGHLRLDNLVLIYDKNDITIDGSLGLSDSTDTALRMKSYGFNVLECDGHDYDDIERALSAACGCEGKPSVIIARTRIARLSDEFEGSCASHGSPLGGEEVSAIKEKIGWPLEDFAVKDGVLNAWRDIGANRFHGAYTGWLERLKASRMMESFVCRLDPNATCSLNCEALLRKVEEYQPNKATRVYSKMVISDFMPSVEGVVGGSADLTKSCGVDFSGLSLISAENYGGNFVSYGIREHAMSAIMNGIAAHSGLVPFGATFLVFSDYMRPAMRLSALMKLRVAYVLTHDSIALGEDGPTHQPIEHLDSLRLIPHLCVVRPSDEFEVFAFWEWFLCWAKCPAVLSLSRQSVVSWRREYSQYLAFDASSWVNWVARGAYVAMRFGLLGESGLTLVFYASGSEVGVVAESAMHIFRETGCCVVVVSVPSVDLFDVQDLEYCQGVLFSNVKFKVRRVFLEMSTGLMLGKFADKGDMLISLSDFGESGPASDVIKSRGMDVNSIVDAVLLRYFS